MRVAIVLSDSDWAFPLISPGELRCSVEVRGKGKFNMMTTDTPEGLDEALEFARRIVERERDNVEQAA